MICEHVAHAVARAFTPQRDRDAFAGGLQRQHMRTYRLENVCTRFGALGSITSLGAA